MMYTKDIKAEINGLLKRVSSGDEVALEELYTQSYKIIFTFLRKYCSNFEIIKDCISMTFVTIIEKCKHKIFFKNCLSWILTIAKFHMYNIKKKYSRYELFNDDFDTEDKNRTFIEDSPTIKEFIIKLNPIDRQIFYLRFYQNLKITEIAKVLSLSLSTIKRKLKQIQIDIKEYIGDE